MLGFFMGLFTLFISAVADTALALLMARFKLV